MMISQTTLKLSKKVSELTQVVHMLFVRNHEKETDLEQMKIAYELEIKHVVSDYKDKLKQLENQMSAASSSSQHKEEQLRDKLHQEQNRRELAEQEFSDKLSEERLQCQTSHDLLIGAEQDIERLKISHQEHVSSRDLIAENLRNEVDSLKQNKRNLETQITSEVESNVIKELRKQQKIVTAENTDLRKQLTESQGKHQESSCRAKALQIELNSLRQRHNSITTVNQERRHTPLTSACFLDYQEESNRLRILVEKYRMELSNRENNFNRMFTQTQPIIVTRSNSANRHSATGRKYLPEVSRVVRSTSASRHIKEEQLIKPRPPTQLFRSIIRR